MGAAPTRSSSGPRETSSAATWTSTRGRFPSLSTGLTPASPSPTSGASTSRGNPCFSIQRPRSAGTRASNSTLVRLKAYLPRPQKGFCGPHHHHRPPPPLCLLVSGTPLLAVRGARGTLITGTTTAIAQRNPRSGFLILPRMPLFFLLRPRALVAATMPLAPASLLLSLT